MRKPIALLLVYLFVLTLSTCAGIFFFAQYFNSLNLVSGITAFFSSDLIIFGLFESLPAVLMTIMLFITFYKIRHLSNPVSSMITYSVLCVFTWFLLLPASIVLKNQVYKQILSMEEIQQSTELTGKYFRIIDGKNYYFINDTVDGTADVVMLYDNRSPNTHAFIKKITISDNNDALSFHDPIMKESKVAIPFHIMELSSSIKKQANESWENGYIAWICFCSLGFALCSIYFVIKMSSWKLVNSLWALIIFIVILWINYSYYIPSFAILKNSLEGFFYDSNHLQYFVNHHISFPLMLINCFIGIVSVVIGIIISTSKNHNR